MPVAMVRFCANGHGFAEGSQAKKIKYNGMLLNSNSSPQLLPMPCYTKAGIWKTKVEKRSISLLLYNGKLLAVRAGFNN
jgi:hypothetical protein